MTKHLDDHPKNSTCGRLKKRPKGLSRRSCAAAKSGWSAERRAKQAALIKSWQPWLRSTGPRTPEGKARVAMNALKHGERSRAVLEARREDREVLHLSARTIALAKEFLHVVLVRRSLAEDASPDATMPPDPPAE